MENVLSLYPGQSWDTSILPVLSSYGEPFMDVVCRDSCDGHDVGRVSHFKIHHYLGQNWLRQMQIARLQCIYRFPNTDEMPAMLSLAGRKD